MQAALFPTQQKWAKLELAPGIRVPDARRPQIAAGLESVTDLVFEHIHASAFDQAVNEWGQDLATGTAALLIQNGRLGTKRPGAPLLQIQAIPAGAVAFDEGPHATVEDVFFFQSIKARLVARTYPDAVLTSAMAAAATAEPEREFTLLQATVYDPEEDAWFFQVVCPDTKTSLLRRKHRSSPWVITRWSKAAREERGRGPLLQCLPDIRVANRLMEDLLVTGSFATSPIYTARDDGVLNTGTLQLMPGMVIPVRSNGGNQGPSLSLLPQPPAPQLAQWILEGLQPNRRNSCPGCATMSRGRVIGWG